MTEDRESGGIPTRWWTRGIAAVLSLIQPGAGHFIIGRYGRGMLWTAGGLTVGFVILLALRASALAALAAVAIMPVILIACAVDTLRVAAGRRRWATTLCGWAALLILSLLMEPAKAYVRENYVQTFTIPSGSMSDTVLVGDYIVVDKSAYRTRSPGRGDIVVFASPLDRRRTFIYHVIGTPGDVVQVRGDELLLNGSPVEEPYVRRGGTSRTSQPCRYAYGCDAVVVPADSFFLMGDDRESAQDSRHWGVVKREDIKGRARDVYWSWDSQRHWLRWWRVGQRLS